MGTEGEDHGRDELERIKLASEIREIEARTRETDCRVASLRTTS
jgi:hypothetical protein